MRPWGHQISTSTEDSGTGEKEALSKRGRTGEQFGTQALALQSWGQILALPMPAV